jgi:hypothetical protein
MHGASAQRPKKEKMPTGHPRGASDSQTKFLQAYPVADEKGTELSIQAIPINIPISVHCLKHRIMMSSSSHSVIVLFFRNTSSTISFLCPRSTLFFFVFFLIAVFLFLDAQLSR